MQGRLAVVHARNAFFGALLLLLVPAARASEVPESAWRVWLEPKFMRTPVTEPFGGAKETVLAAGQLQNGELSSFGKWEFSAAASDWATFRPKAAANAAADLAKLQPKYTRDSRQVILYAALESKEPIVSSAVLAPGFLDLWKETLGEKVLVVVPNRFSAYVFPRLSTEYAAYSPMIWRAYKDTAWPVSVEVFEVSSTGWQCLGAYERP